MDVRRSALAGTWYPGDESRCRQAIAQCLSGAPPAEESLVVGGLAPHAGWVYSGSTAATAFSAIGSPAPATVVLLGFSHRTRVCRSEISAAAAWDTPLGPLRVHRELADALIEACPDLLGTGDLGHPPGENSIEVLLPFVRFLFPDTLILPIAVAPGPSAVELGRALGSQFRKAPGRIAVIGSTDLTHYGSAHYGFAPRGSGAEAHRWAKEVNDQSFLDRILALDAAGAMEDAARNRSACGASAAAAAVAAGSALGATSARLLRHTTSFEAQPEGGTPTDFVGYASVVFERPAG